MAKLALALVAKAIEDPLSIPVDRLTSNAAYKALGETVLLYRLAGGSFVIYEAVGKVAGVEIGSDGQRVCRVSEVRRFSTPQTLERPGLRARHTLEVAEFEAIVSAGEATAIFDEAAAPTYRGPASAVPAKVYRQVLEAYGYRCAVTHREFPRDGLPDDLHLVFIQPRNQGGPLHVQNLIPMVAEAEADWVRGAISATADQLLALVWARISGEVAEAVDAHGGRLHLPEEPQYRPGSAYLAYHRETIFGR